MPRRPLTNASSSTRNGAASTGALTGSVRTLVRALATATDLSMASICEAAGIDLEVITDPDARIELDALVDVWRAVVEMTGERHLGLRAAANYQPSLSTIVRYSMISAETIGDSLQCAYELQRIHLGSDDVLHLERNPDWLLFGYTFPFFEPLFAQNHAEYIAGGILKFISWTAGQPIHPLEVRFRHAPLTDISTYQDYYGCPARFEVKEDGLLFDGSSMRLPSQHAVPSVAQIHQLYAEQQAAESVGSSLPELRARLRLTFLLEKAPGGAPSETAIAKALNMSPRTLQRRLMEAGTTYREVVDAVRRDAAMELVQGSDLALKEIAHRLGFQDQSSLTHAFRRWWGQAPSAFRGPIP